MSPRKQSLLLGIRVSSDLVMVSLGWVVAYYLRFYSGLDTSRGVPSPLLYFKLIPFIAGIWLAVLSAAGFYRRTGKHRSAFLEAIDILQSCILATLAFIAFTYFYEEYRYSRWALIFFAAIHPWFIIAGRSGIRKALRYYRRHAPRRRTLVIGGGEILQQAISLSETLDITASQVFGAILVGNAEQIALSTQFCQANGIAVLPMQKDWSSFFAEHQAQTVIFALPNNAYAFLEENLEGIVNQVADVKLVPDLMRYTKFAAGIEVMRGVPVVSIHESPLAGIGSVVKRAVDIVGSGVGIVVCAPIMAATALLVKLSSPGPIFYRQERMGLDGKTFHIIKFRTMPIDAERTTGAVWAKPDDDRSTNIGGFLRRSSLDEIPQLFNVWSGDMSLVGPRPERPVFVNQFRKKVPGYMLRHKVKAGMTGWAQVNGWRGNTSLEKRIECDLYYIQNWSLWLDVRIFALTIVRGFFNKNAY